MRKVFMLKIYDVLNNKFKDINNFDEWVEHLKAIKAIRRIRLRRRLRESVFF